MRSYNWFLYTKDETFSAVLKSKISFGKNSPVDDVVEATGLRHGEVLALLADLCRLRFGMFRINIVKKSRQARPLRGVHSRVTRTGLLLLWALIENNEFVFLPVTSFRVLITLRGWKLRGLREGSVFAAARFRWGIGLAVWFEGALRTAHQGFASIWGYAQGVVLVAQMLLCQGTLLFPSFPLLLLLGQAGEAVLSGAHPNRMDHSIQGLPLHFLIPSQLSWWVWTGMASGWAHAGSATGEIGQHRVVAIGRQAVFVMDDASLWEVWEIVFGICQLAKRKGKTLHGKLAVKVRAVMTVDPVKHADTIGSPISESRCPSRNIFQHLMGSVTVNVLR